MAEIRNGKETFSSFLKEKYYVEDHLEIDRHPPMKNFEMNTSDMNNQLMRNPYGSVPSYKDRIKRQSISTVQQR